MLLQDLGMALTNRLVALPQAEIPAGELVDLPDRGTTYVVDLGGPSPTAPTVLLLHPLGCTGLLGWFPSLDTLSTRFRVVVMDQRWHGKGICSDRFRLADCADDAAALIAELGLGPTIVVGYSMGSVVAQMTWYRHPGAVDGLVLCASTDSFRQTSSERFFHAGMGMTMAGLRGLAYARSEAMAARAQRQLQHTEPVSDLHQWALAEFRSTSPWAVGQALGKLGRFSSREWIGGVDVPSAVVVTNRDRAIPADRQRGLAMSIPGATLHEVDGGHASCVLGHDRFLPSLMEACQSVSARLDVPRPGLLARGRTLLSRTAN
ncbi:MAG: alpha/beta hydrolase [Actinomycetota bacterium]|nr:alpha/beta hydrolase [Actinomycetota bacterium]